MLNFIRQYVGSSSNPLVAALEADANGPQLVHNEKGAFDWDRIGQDATSKVLEFWYQAVRNASPGQLLPKLEAAYHEDPLLTVKAIFQIRDIRGGKGERQLGRICFEWLARNHPKTMEANLWAVVEMGRWDDLYSLWTVPEIWPAVQKFITTAVQENFPLALYTVSQITDHRQTSAQNLVERLRSFGVALPENSPKPLGKTNLIGKWLAGEDSKWNNNQYKRLVRSLAKTVCRALNPEVKSKDIWPMYRRICSVLRMPLELVETALASKHAETINYNTVPGQAMRRYGTACGNAECLGKEAKPPCKKCKAFIRQDRERFQVFLNQLREQRVAPKDNADAKVNSRTLHPHEVTKGYKAACDSYGRAHPELDEMLEAMWSSIKARINGAALGRMLPMLDVSGSMNGLPFEAGAALALLISTAIPADNEFHRCLISFTDTPEFHKVRGETLRDQITSLSGMRVGYSTHFRLALELVLNTAVRLKLPQSVLPDVILVLTDGQWDVFDKGYKTGIANAAEMFRQAGYQMPRMVLWNLRATNTYPTSVNENHCTLVSGFSPEVLNCILNGENFSPASAMLNILGQDRYSKLVVKD